MLVAMANHHFGEIGDVWKHLPLLVIASAEGPAAYWESHSGSAAYPWEATDARRFGAQRFLELSAEHPVLETTRYHFICKRSLEQSKPVYPGSPRLMLELLAGQDIGFVFCDLDGASIASIEMDADRAGVAEHALSCVIADGNRALVELAGAIDRDAAGRVLAMLDPFSLEAVGEGGVSALDALHALAAKGVRIALWWCAKSPEERKARSMLVERAIEGCGETGAVSQTIIVGDDNDAEATAARFGVWSCTLTLVNCSERAKALSEKLGAALAGVYADAADVGADAPALRFESTVHAPKGATL